jgi:hypothetical protein
MDDADKVYKEAVAAAQRTYDEAVEAANRGRRESSETTYSPWAPALALVRATWEYDEITFVLAATLTLLAEARGDTLGEAAAWADLRATAVADSEGSKRHDVSLEERGLRRPATVNVEASERPTVAEPTPPS